MPAIPYAFTGSAGGIDGHKDTTATIDATQDLRWSPDGVLLYVADYTAGRLRIVDTATGQVTSAATTLNRPEGVGVDPAGNVYVGDVGNDRLMKFGPGGSGGTSFLTGVHGLGGAVRHCPADDLLYFNSDEPAVSRVPLSGGTPTVLRSDFAQVEGLAFVAYDGTFDVLVSDFLAGVLYRMSRAAPHARTVVASGLNAPEGVDIVGSVVYIAQRGNGTLGRYDLATGQFSEPAEGFVTPTGVAAHPATGGVFAADLSRHQVMELIASRWSIGRIGR